MSVVKRSVSFDAGIWADLQRAAGSSPVSPVVNEAVALYLRRQRGLAAVESYEAAHGAFTDAELAEADRLLDAAGVVDLRVAEAAPKAPRRAATTAPRRAASKTATATRRPRS